MTFNFDTGSGSVERAPKFAAGWGRDAWRDAISDTAGADAPHPRFYEVAADFITNRIWKYKSASSVRGAFLAHQGLITEMCGVHAPAFDRVISEFAERLAALETDVPPGAPCVEHEPAAPAAPAHPRANERTEGDEDHGF